MPPRELKAEVIGRVSALRLPAPPHAPQGSDVLAAQRRQRARIRSEKGHRWGRPKIKTEAA